MEVVFTVSVLILDGFCDAPFTDGNGISAVSDIYIPLLSGLFGANGISCSVWEPSGLEYDYSLNGCTGENLIYVPVLSYSQAADKMSFIYTDSTSPYSTSFRIASRLRHIREELFGGVIFVNALHDNDPLRSFSPIVTDSFTVPQALAQDFSKTAFSVAASTVKAVCEHFGQKFAIPR